MELKRTLDNEWWCSYKHGPIAKWTITHVGASLHFCDSCLDQLLALKKPKLRYEIVTDPPDAWVRDTQKDRYMTMRIELDLARKICDALNSIEAVK